MDTAKTFKGRDGKWRAEQIIELGQDLMLSIVSRRGSRGFYCSASVYHREGDCLTHAVYQDYMRHLGEADFRSTEKNVREFHEQCVSAFGLDNVIAEARCHHREQLEQPVDTAALA